MAPLIRSALNRIKTAYRPSTRAAHNTHLRTYLAFTIFMSLPHHPSPHTLLAFMEFLHANSLSHKVILIYLSSIKKAASRYHWSLSPFSHQSVLTYLRSISINSSFAPTPRGIFDLTTLALIFRRSGATLAYDNCSISCPMAYGEVLQLGPTSRRPPWLLQLYPQLLQL